MAEVGFTAPCPTHLLADLQGGKSVVLDGYVRVEGVVDEGADGGGAGLVAEPPIIHGCQGDKEPKDQYQEEQKAEDESPNAKQPAACTGGAGGGEGREIRMKGEEYVKDIG